MAIVVQTDRAWDDDSIERDILAAAGHELVPGPQSAPDAKAIEAAISQHDPAAIMACWASVTAAAINAPTKLRIVQRMGAGLDNIDIDAATRRGAWVANVPDFCVEEVSDHALALMLSWARGIVPFDRAAKAGEWNPASAKLRRVRDLRVGIIGLGRVGQTLARKLAGLGCETVFANRSPRPETGLSQLPVDALCQASDVIVLTVPLTPQTEHMMDRRRLAMMRKGALLINVGRGPLVDNAALVEALDHGSIAGAALDVIEGEPNPPLQLMGRSDVIVTPHIAFSSDASLAELRRRSAQEIVRVLAGEAPLHPCNSPAG